MMRTANWCVAWIVVVASCVLGCGDGKRAAGPAPFDCAPLVAHMRSCADDFWAAYATTGRARTKAGARPIADHVAEERATFEASGLDALCERETARDASPAWRRRLVGCSAAPGCQDWAACLAPALFDGP
jgi:hypothetical protein